MGHHPHREESMRLRPLVWVVLAVPVNALAAQGAADARWVAQCRDGERGWRAKHCEVRVVTLAPGGPIAVDPGENGGVAGEGWVRDSIEGHARIQTQGTT